MYQGQPVAVLIPARDESANIGQVVNALIKLRDSDDLPLIDRVIVCDNGSTDDTHSCAAAAGAEVVQETQPGYGAACRKAVAALLPASTHSWMVFIDGDGSADTKDIPRLLHTLTQGADLAIGSRTLGRHLGLAEAGATFLTQRWGTGLATRLMSMLWNQPVSDLGPLRALSVGTFLSLDMQDTAFGWTVEMQVKALQRGLRVEEIPVASLRRKGRSKISGTLKGTVLAAHGIFSTIFKLRYQQARQN